MTVLLIDDDTDLLQMTTRRLNRKGYTVIEASNYAEALIKFNDTKDQLQAVICDLFLGNGGNGIDIFEKIKNEYTGPFILSTGDDNGDTRIQKYEEENGKFACLQKPFELAKLIEIIGEPKK